MLFSFSSCGANLPSLVIYTYILIGRFVCLNPIVTRRQVLRQCLTQAHLFFLSSMASGSDTGSESTDRNKSSSKSKKKYQQKYKQAWEREKSSRGWLQSSKKGNNYAYCKTCDMNLIAGKVLLERHMKSAKHEDNTKKLKSQLTMVQAMPQTALSSSSQVKEAEVRMALFIAEHDLPFTVMEHLPKLVKKLCPDSDIAKQIECSRTKTSMITKAVTGEESKSRLWGLLREKKFSVMVDESTDIGCSKHLCVVTRVFDENKVKDAFFDLIAVTDVTADGLHSALSGAFERAGVPYKRNLVGFAADGASVMMGSRHSVMALLKKEIPSLFVLKCTCHSFHLCASYACTKLPRVVEDLVRDVYSYFSSSPKRIDTLKKFQAFLELKPHKLLHPAQTRWLSLLAAVDRFLEQYDAL